MLVTVPFFKNELKLFHFKACICSSNITGTPHIDSVQQNSIQQSGDARKQHGTIWKQTYEESIKYLSTCEVSHCLGRSLSEETSRAASLLWRGTTTGLPGLYYNSLWHIRRVRVPDLKQLSYITNDSWPLKKNQNCLSRPITRKNETM